MKQLRHVQHCLLPSWVHYVDWGIARFSFKSLANWFFKNVRFLKEVYIEGIFQHSIGPGGSIGSFGACTSWLLNFPASFFFFFSTDSPSRKRRSILCNSSLFKEWPPRLKEGLSVLPVEMNFLKANFYFKAKIPFWRGENLISNPRTYKVNGKLASRREI